MDLNQILTLIIQGTFVLIALVTVVDWARHPHATRRDVAIMFGAFSLIIVTQWIGEILGATPRALVIVGNLLLIAHPYLLLRLIHHFWPVSRTVDLIARVGLLASWLILLVLPTPLATWADFLLVGYFAFVETYAAAAFVRGAANSAGVTHGRLSLGAIGSGMLALFILAVGAGIAFPPLAPVFSVLSQLAGLLAGLSYYFAFATPVWLRRLWQLDELGRFVREGAGHGANEPVAFFLERLCRASVRTVGGSGAVVVFPDTGENRFRVAGTSDLLKDWQDKPLDAPELGRAWRDCTRVVALRDDWSKPEKEMADSVKAGALLICPLETQDRAWGLLLVLTRRVPLFVRDDFKLLVLLCEQTGIALAYSTSIDEQRRMVDKLREQAEQLSTTNRELENEILERESAQNSLRTTVEALRRSEEELRALFAAMTDRIFVVDRKGTYLSVAPTTPRAEGITRNRMGQTIDELSSPDQAAIIRTYLQLALDTRQVIKAEYQTEENGSATWFAATISPLDADRALWVARDVTERKQAEVSLQHYSQRLESLNEIDRAILAARSPEEIASVALRRINRIVPYDRAGVVLFDRELSQARFFTVDQTKDYGPTAGTVIPLADLAPPDVLQRNLQAYFQDITTLPDPSPVLQTFVSTGIRSVLFTPLVVEGKLIGELNLLASRPDAFNEEHQEIAREVANQMAVTLQQARLRDELQRHASELEDRVAQRTAQLQAANKELEAFSYSVSHDLRAPLRSIISFTDLMYKDFGEQMDPSANRYLELVRDNAIELSNMVEHLLKFSRTGREAFNLQLISPEELVRHTLDPLVSEVPGRRLDIQIDPLPACYADPGLLKQVWQNLLSNAIKFTSACEVARIKIGFCERDGEGVYFVKDNGVGFDMRYASKLFGVFQRLHHSEDYPGTGVGLAIVQRIINRHGGRIWAESQPDQGATFYFSLGTGNAPVS